MDPRALHELLTRLSSGEASVDEVQAKLETLPFEDLGFARIDHHRALRTGFPEVVYGPGKRPAEIAAIAQSIHRRGQTALVTRVDPDKAEAAIACAPEALRAVLSYEEIPRLLVAGPSLSPRGRGVIAVVSAGTSDRPVAEEAARTAEIFGQHVERYRDVGIAGLHRLLAVRDALDAASVVIVVAGMEGALPSAVAGLIAAPVIAVPTSVGFGASLGGVAALLGMLSGCAAGVTVVNIDNGFGAGYAAALMNLERA